MKVTFTQPPYPFLEHPLSSGQLENFASLNGQHFTANVPNIGSLKIGNKIKTSLEKLPPKVLTPEEITHLLKEVSATRHADRNLAMIALSFFAGLRPSEIAHLTWPQVLGPKGRMKSAIVLGAGKSNSTRFRTIPLSTELKNALRNLHEKVGKPTTGPVIQSERGDAMTSRAVVNWFKSTCTAAGLDGCTSNSGRRTFITAAARKLARSNGSFRDLQELAGHRSVSTTKRYILADSAMQRELVNLLGLCPQPVYNGLGQLGMQFSLGDLKSMKVQTPQPLTPLVIFSSED